MRKNEKNSNQLSDKTKLTLYYITAICGLLAAIFGFHVHGSISKIAPQLFLALVYGIILPASLKNKQK